MKRCPQCNSVYNDEIAFCLNDGAALVEESFSLPSMAESDEPETIIRNEPIVIDFADTSIPPPPAENYQIPQPAENVVIVPANTASINRNYAVFLIVGLLIGGGLVLATLLLSRNLYQNENTVRVKTDSNYNQAVAVETPRPSPEVQNKNENINKNEDVLVETVSNKHAEPNESAIENTNGRVIALNARIRFAPDKDAPIVDTLPMNDRIEIIRRQNSNSPWYQVECEHGTTGWMHGDTIEFTR